MIKRDYLVKTMVKDYLDNISFIAIEYCPIMQLNPSPPKK